MLHLLDETLEAFLREEVPLPPRQIDVSFEAPDDEWGAKLSRPTVNLFLWDVRQNFSERMAGADLVEENGKKFRRPPLPRVDCRYLITAWTTDVGDEHQLLGSLLMSFLAHGEIDGKYLRGSMAEVRPLPRLVVASPAETTSSDFWSAVGGKLKPGLDLLVTAVVDVGLMREAGPPVDQYDFRLRKMPGGVPAGSSTMMAGHADPEEAGTFVFGPRGASMIRQSGDFAIVAQPGDPIETTKAGAKAPVKIVAPKRGSVQMGQKAKPAEGGSGQDTKS